MVRFGRSAAITPYPPPANITAATLIQIIRRRRRLRSLPLPNPLPLLDIRTPPVQAHRAATNYQYARHTPNHPFTRPLHETEGPTRGPPNSRITVGICEGGGRWRLRRRS